MEYSQTDPLEGLTPMERSFVLHFCQYRIASKAARAAGYSVKSAKEIGHQVLNKPHVSAAISTLMEQSGMSVGECIGRMTAWARGTMDPFMNRRGELSLTTEEAVNNRHLLKKVRQKTTVRTLQDGITEKETQIEVELHDAKDAVDKMLQLHGRYKQLPGDANQPKQLTSYTLPDGSQLIF